MAGESLNLIKGLSDQNLDLAARINLRATLAQVDTKIATAIAGLGSTGGGSGGGTTTPPVAGAATLSMAESNWFGSQGSYTYPDLNVTGPSGFAQLARIADTAPTRSTARRAVSPGGWPASGGPSRST